MDVHGPLHAQGPMDMAAQTASRPSASRRAYEAPRLTAYGSVGDLTAGGTTGGKENTKGAEGKP